MKTTQKLLLIPLTCLCLTVHAQSSDIDSDGIYRKEWGMVMGVHQFHYTCFELGLSRARSNVFCGNGVTFTGKSLSVLYNPFQKTGGLAADSWVNFFTFITFGIEGNTLTDFSRYNVGIKPYIGIGGRLSLTYGYNFQVLNQHVPGVNRHCFALRFHWALATKGGGSLNAAHF